MNISLRPKSEGIRLILSLEKPYFPLLQVDIYYEFF